MTVRDALRHGTQYLRATGIEGPRLEARLLLAHALGTTAEGLLRDQNATADRISYDRLLARRAAHEPLAHIVGHREFWSLDFLVSNATLIPRPDSESLIEAALAVFAGRAAPRTVLDLGTGTGCLLLAALHEFPAAFGIGVDFSPAAARLAASNAARLGLAGRAAFLCGDWADALDCRCDLVLSNPPYIPTGELAGLMPDVAGYEPMAALDGGADGTTAYRRLVPELHRLLQPGGVAVLEIGQGQAAGVTTLALQAGFRAAIRPDLGGIPRAVVLQTALP